MNRTFGYMLAGLETGVSGSLAMLAWLTIPSLWSRRTVWWIPNLFASAITHHRVSYFRFTYDTVLGLALDFFVYGLVGSLFGFVWRDGRGGSRLVWAGVLTGLGTWYLFFRIGWRSVSPAAGAYTSDRQFLIGSLIYGLMLARYHAVAVKVAARTAAADVG